MTRASRPAAIGAAAFAVLLVASPLAADTLEDVRERGWVRCGVNVGLDGFASANSLGEYTGFDIDLCRAVAVAALGDDVIEAVPTTAGARFDDLAAARFDVLSRDTTWTLEREARHGQFAGTSFHDGQGFMVPRSAGARSALELDGARLCVVRGSVWARNAEEFFTLGGLDYRPVVAADEDEAFVRYARGDCDAVTADRSRLGARRAALERPDAHAILPELISKEPLGPLVRDDDPVWENLVRWSLACLVDAEELGLSSANVDEPEANATRAARVLLGREGDVGGALGLGRDWCADIVRTVGNYAEIYERHLGPDTPLGLPRGLNELWTNGGLLFAPPLR